MKILKTKRATAVALGVIGSVALVGAACGGSGGGGDALKIGYLADYSNQLATLAPQIERGVELAVEQINAAGGVNGQIVSYVTGDSQLDGTVASTEATRLIEVEGIHALVGPLGSGPTSAVSEGIIADAQIPHISPSATAPSITVLNDNGFTFRTALSDAAQGAALADNLVEMTTGFASANIGVIYINNTYGQGLLGAFENSYAGTVVSAAYEEDATTYSAELERLSDTDGLIIIGYNESVDIFRQAEQAGDFDTYFFVDGNQEAPFPAETHGALEGHRGTAPTSDDDSPARTAFNATFMARYGEEAGIFNAEAYDATIALALATARAGSVDGTAIRDELVGVGNAPGLVVTGGDVASIRAGLQAAANGNDVNYEGVASTVAWNEAGDVTSGFVEIWEWNSGSPTNVSTQAFSLE